MHFGGGDMTIKKRKAKRGRENNYQEERRLRES
jgi:hypothetical protein